MKPTQAAAVPAQASAVQTDPPSSEAEDHSWERLLVIPETIPAPLRQMITLLDPDLQMVVLAALNSPNGVQLTIANAKGGVMKTTLAVYTALMLALTGEQVLLVDADDTNRTCLKWNRLAGQAWPRNVMVVGWADDALRTRIDNARANHRHIIVDVGPSDTSLIKQAWLATGHGIVPTQQYPGDVVQLPTTFELLRELTEPVKLQVLLSRAFPARKSFTNAVNHISGQGYPLLKGHVPHLEYIAEEWGALPAEFTHFAEVVAEILGVPRHEIDRRMKRAA
ncbi:AAA family ATPase [Embleya scabrispora]|nr:AAA family ATPase [Embleya scabrispora]